MIERTISHYKIVEKLGEGGMGMVYKAEDTKLKRTVAIKFLPPDLIRDDGAKSRFIHEAQAASALEHHNICTIHEIDQAEDGQLFVVMACYEGGTLKDNIDRGPLKIDEVVDIASQIAHGLSKAHEKGIVHRDIKPSNIFITTDGIVKIIDFGLAKLHGRTVLTREGSTLGTVNYMSPEQARGGDIDHRTDTWALGVIIYEMMTGQPPFRGEYEQAVMYSIMNEEPEPVTGLRTGVPMELERIVNKALAKSPEERYQHMDDLLADMKRILKERESSSLPRRALSPEVRKSKSKTILLSAASLIVLIAVAFFLRPLLFDEILISEPKPVAVIAFDNQTGDQSLDYLREAIPNLLITSLEQSKYLRVMTWERMNDVLKQMGKDNMKFIDKELGFELCQREGINAMVIGSYIKAGESFASDVKVLDVGTKELLKTASARGVGVQSIINTQIDQLSEEIARGVGLSQRKVQSSPSRIAEVTTNSMEAYNYFLRGREDYEKIYDTDAKRFLEKAVALDSGFAMAYLYLAKTYSRLIEYPKRNQALEKANTLSFKAPEKERLAIQSYYAAIIEKNPDKRLKLLEEMVRKYPNEKRFHDELGLVLQSRNRILEAQSECEKAVRLDPDFAAPINTLGYLYAEQGLYEKAIQTLQRYALLSPGDANPFDSMGEIYLRMGNLEKSISKYHEALRVQPSFYPAYSSLAYVYALKEDWDKCFQCVDTLLSAAPSFALKANARSWKFIFLKYTGRYQDSLHETKLFADLIRQITNLSLFPPSHWGKAWDALERGNVSKAKQEFAAFHESYSQGHPQTPIFNEMIRSFNLAHIYLRQARLDSARVCFEEMRTKLDSIELFRNTFVMLSGILEAELLLAEGMPDRAIRVYRQTPVIGPSMAVGWRMPFYVIPPLRDVVPRAFQKKGELDSAIVAYERLLKINPANKDRRLIHPLYHYRLALLCEKTGRMDEAVTEYQKFLKAWEKADQDRPELIDAKKRLARLES